MTYEGPGITTQSEVKRSVNEGKGKLAMPILCFEVTKGKWNRTSVGLSLKDVERREGSGGENDLRIVVRNTPRVTK
jgi:hypothetical protein